MRHLLQARSFLTSRQTMQCGFTLKLLRDMIITCTQMHRTDKYSEQSLIIWAIQLHGWVSINELSGCEFKAELKEILSYKKSVTSIIKFRKKLITLFAEQFQSDLRCKKELLFILKHGMCTCNILLQGLHHKSNVGDFALGISILAASVYQIQLIP